MTGASCYPCAVMSSARKETVKALTARAGDSWCALPLSRVRRVVRRLKLFPLPGASDHVAGLAEIDGEPLVVLSLERLVGAPTGATSELPVTLLVESGAPGSGEVLGLIADEAGEIVHLDESQVVGPSRGLIRGEAHLEHGIVRLLDLARLGRTS